MPQNPRTIVRTTRGRLGIVAAGVITVSAFAILIPASAFAAPAAGSPSSAHTARASALPAASSGAVTVKMPGTANSCTSYWAWQANNYLHNGGYTQVKWTSNPCGYSIQERSWCNAGSGSGWWSTSGIVFGVNIWDKSSCTAGVSYASRGEVHFNYQDGNGWTTYQTFWTG
jgi:hypothetical protein